MKKNKKTFISFLLVAAMTVSVFPINMSTVSAAKGNINSAAEAEEATKGDAEEAQLQDVEVVTAPEDKVGGDWTYYRSNFDGEDGVTISGYKGSAANVVIPSTLGGYEVKGIDYQAFRDNQTMTSITIPESVSEIGNSAFRNCSKLAGKIDLSHVKKLGTNIFYECTSIEEVVLPDKVQDEYDYLGGMFYGCTKLKKATIPSNLTKIPNGYFNGCSSLETVNIPKTIKEIGSFSFNNCEAVSNITIPEGVTSIGEWAFSGCKSIKTITIPEGVTSIGESAFNGCKSIKTITIPSGVTSLPYCAFYNSGLQTLKLNEGLEEIGDWVFGGCQLSSIDLPSTLKSIGNDAFFDNTEVSCLSIPAKLTSLAEDALEGLTGLEEINVDSNNTAYASKDGVLYNKDFSQMITWPSKKDVGEYLDGQTEVENEAFYGNNGITTLTFPDSVKNIGNWSFANCQNLTTVKISSNLTNISETAFAYDEALTDIQVSEDNPVYSSKDGCLFDKSGTTLLYYPPAKDTFEIPEGVTTIGTYAFAGTSLLTSIIIPASVTKIYGSAFMDCDKLTSITVAEDNTSYISKNGYLYEADGSTLAAIPEGLGSNDIPSDVTKLGDRLFYYSNLQGKFNLPDNITSIGSETFGKCDNLSVVIIPNSVVDIADDAFMGSDIKIYGALNSYAEKYATSHNIPFYIYSKDADNIENVVVKGSASEDNSGITLSWNKCPGAEGYKIYRQQGEGGGKGYVLTYTVLGENTLSYLDKTGDSSERLYYYIVGFFDDKESDFEIVEAYNPDKALISKEEAKVSCEVTNNGIKVNWTKCDHAESYVVYRARINSIFIKVADIPNNDTFSFLDTKCSQNIEYSYLVYGVRKGIQSKPLDIHNSVIMLSTQKASVSNDTTGIKVNWQEVESADVYYNIYRKTSGGSYKKIAVVKDAWISSYVDKTAESGKTYVYAVRALAFNKQLSPYTGSTAIKRVKSLSTPIVTTTNGTKGETVKWNKISNALGYYVYRKTTTGSYKLIGTVKSGSTVSFVDTQAVSGTNYYYTVRAYNGKVLSGYKNSKAVRYLKMPVAKASKTSTGIKIAWNKISKANGYVIYRRKAGGSFAVLTTIKSGSTVSYTDKTAKKGVTYYYTVRAYNGSFKSAYVSTSGIKR